jgi:hypothetical protein
VRIVLSVAQPQFQKQNKKASQERNEEEERIKVISSSAD